MSYIDELRPKIELLPQGSVREFWQAYLPIREMIYDTLDPIPDGKLDYKPVEGDEIAALRECIAELPRVEKSLIEGMKTGTRKMGAGSLILENIPTKEEMKEAFEKMDTELFELTTTHAFNPESIIRFQGYDGENKGEMTAMNMLWGLRNHENMHLGMIRRDLDAIGVNPPPSYTKYWYG